MRAWEEQRAATAKKRRRKKRVKAKTERDENWRRINRNLKGEDRSS